MYCFWCLVDMKTISTKHIRIFTFQTTFWDMMLSLMMGLKSICAIIMNENIG